MSIELITLVLFVALLIGLMLGLPIAFVMGGIGVAASIFLWGPQGLNVTVFKFYEYMRQPTLIAIPFFILTGYFLERSGIAEELYEMMYRWLGFLRGGLAIGTVLICTIFAAMTGVTAAATVTMGIIALPSMLKRNYDKTIAVGTVAGGGTLGILIPPSVLMVILGTATGVSVGKLFMGGFLSGFVLSALFVGYIVVRSKLQPQLCPKSETTFGWAEKLRSLRAIILPVLLILAILGSIFFGIATPTEASGVGAVGALACVFIHRRFSWQLLKEATTETLKLTSMVLWIIFGSVSFIAVYTGIGATELVKATILGLEFNRWFILGGMMFVLFIMGMFIDPGGIILLAAPIFGPIVKDLGFDQVWFGVLFIIMLQIGYLTPPFGYNLFYMRSVCPPSITMEDIYRSVFPFILLMIVGVVIIMIFPQIALWLPTVMLR